MNNGLVLRCCVAVGFVCAAGCSTNEPESRVAQPCVTNGDCTEMTECIRGRCHTKCQTSGNCEAFSQDADAIAGRCVVLDEAKICLLSDEIVCAGEAATCPDGLLCGGDDQCHNDCAIDRNCVSGQVCVNAVCVEPQVNDDAGSSGDAASTDEIGQTLDDASDRDDSATPTD